MGIRNEIIDDDDLESLKNYDFYNDKVVSVPRGDYLSKIHETWVGDYEKLEEHHGYVQWLFPIREGGMNFQAQPFSKHESGLFRKSKEIMERCIKSYKLMLDFYGMVLIDEKSGEVGRNPSTYVDRYLNLNHSFHNYLRITRMMKWLGVVGLEHYKFKLLNHMVLEVFKEKTLSNAKRSCLSYWIPTLRRKKDIVSIDNLVNTFMKINRDELGYGDDDESWQTKYYRDEVNDSDHAQSYITYDTVKVSDVDPFEGIERKGGYERRREFVGRMKRKFERDSDSDSEDEKERKRRKLDKDNNSEEL